MCALIQTVEQSKYYVDSSSGRGSSLHARTREDGHHAGLLPGEDEEALGDRRHQRDPQAEKRLDRDSRTRKSCGTILSAHKVAVKKTVLLLLGSKCRTVFTVNKYKISGRKCLDYTAK